MAAGKKTPKEETPLDLALAEIRKDDPEAIQYGQSTYSKVGVQTTGLLSLDCALGCGGVPRGRVLEVFGGESSGKTTLTLHLIAECQRNGGTAAFIDVEHALDPTWASRIGVDMSKLLISQPSSGEQALQMVNVLARHGVCDLIVVDSVAALVPECELDEDMDKEARIGGQARLMSKALRKLAPICSKGKTSIIFINQLRDKIGGFAMFGTPESTPGGRALKFYASVRLEVKKTSTIKIGDNPIGNKAKIKVVKNKVAPPFKTAEMTIYYGSPYQKKNECNPIPSFGMDQIESLLEGAKDLGVITVKGANYYFGETKVAVGANSTLAALRSNQELVKEIKAAAAAVIESFKDDPVEAEIVAGDDVDLSAVLIDGD